MSLTKGTEPFGERPAGAFNFDPHPPKQVLYLKHTVRRVRVLLAGQLVADSDDVRLLDPPGRTPTYLFPREAGAILRAPARVRRLVGYVGHSVLAVGIVLLYATFFAAVAHNDHLALWGVFAGTVHGTLGGVVVGAWPDLDPRIPRPVPSPGVFYRHYGRRDVLTFLAGHLFFGALAATLYAVLHEGVSAAAAL